MKKILLLSLLLVAAMFQRALSQDRTVTGKVTSLEDGSALPGVNVQVKGTSTGTSTGPDGNYSITAPDGSTLVFSFIGLATQEEVLGSRTVINITLKTDVKQLGEVVVTALGIQREAKSLGYSVERVKSDQVAQKSEPDVLRTLQGKIAGVNITGSSGIAGSSTRITIRGNRSFYGNNQPLFVVDGVPFDNSQTSTTDQLTTGAAYASRIADIDPNNIESMTVLKGGAAAALYGVRASNGVVIITTKSGSGNKSKKGLEIALTSGYSQETLANLPDYQNTYGSGSLNTYAAANGQWGAPFGIGTGLGVTNDSIPIWTTYSAAFPALAGTKVPYKAYPNNVKDFFKTGSVFDNSLTVSGGNEKSNLTAVVSRMKQEGFIPNSSFDRTSLSLGGRTVLDNKLIIGGNMAYTESNQKGPLLGASGASDPDNTSVFARTMYLGRNWDLQGYPYTRPDGGSVFFVSAGQADNPRWAVENNKFTSSVNRFAGNVNASYDIVSWLNLSAKVGINSYTDRRTQVIGAGSRAANGIGRVTENEIFFREFNSNLVLTFNKDLSEDLNLKVVLGHNVNSRYYDNRGATGLGIVSRGIDRLSNTNQVTPLAGTSTGGGVSSVGITERALWGLFGDITLSYKDWLFLDVTARNDHSSTLSKANRSFFYPAASASFVFTDALKIESNILTSGKLRASVSQVGNEADPYQIFSTYQVGANANTYITDNSFPFRGQTGGAINSTIFDPNLKAEFTSGYELGTQLGFFSNRINLDFNYYQTKTTDQIAPISLPSGSGFASLLTNFGAMENKGIEIGLDLTPIQLENGFKWNIYTTFTRNRSKVLYLREGVDEIILRNLFGGGITPVLKVGEAYGVFRGTVAARDDNGNLLIDPRTGLMITSPDTKIIGNPNPDFLMGITNSFSFKGITLTAVLDYRKGGDIYSQTGSLQLGRGVTKDTEERRFTSVVPGILGDPNTYKPLLTADGKTQPNNIQVLTNELYFQNSGGSFATNAPEEFEIWDGTTIRLREISLGYSLPKNLLKSTPFGSVSLTFTSRNLWYNAVNFPKASHFDPETSTLGASNAQGFDFTNAPTVKRYGVNLRLTF